MGCHHFNIPKRALKLGHPIRVSATSIRVSDETAPLASIVTWEFPARQGMPSKTLKRRSGTWGEWFEAMRGGETATCEFTWAGPLSEIVLLGNIAIRADQILNWDGPKMQFTNNSQANQFLKESYRTGWSL